MNEQEKRSLSVYLIALAVILSNLAILSVLYQAPFLSGFPAVKKALPFLSMAAVYPHDFLQIYFRQDLIIHFYWILSVMISGFGLLLFNQFSRVVFITFNILHFVVLGMITFSHFGRGAMFWDYFFTWYFNLVVFLMYSGYLTLPEVREQFKSASKEMRFDLWFLKVRRRALGSKDAEGFYNLGLAYRRLGRIDEAEEFLTRAVQITPGNAEYHFHLGQILQEKENYGPSVNALKEAVRLDPLHKPARKLLGAVYERMGCLEEAVQTFRRVTFLETNKGEVFRRLGTTCYRAGHWEEAEQSLQKAIALDPQDHIAYYYLGLIFMRDEQRAGEAEDMFKKAVRIKPDHLESYSELGNLYVQSGDHKNAVRAYRDVLRLDPNRKEAHYQLGFAYAILKDLDSARREYQYLKDVDPDLARTLGMLLKQ